MKSQLLRSSFCLATLCVSTGCAGVYAQAGLSKLGLGYSVNTNAKTEAPVVANPVEGSGLTFTLAAGLEFDVKRKARLALEGQYKNTDLGGGGSASGGTGGIGIDFTAFSITNDLKLRGALAGGYGSGSASVMSTAGTLLKKTDSGDAQGYGGVGVAYYIGRFLVAHLNGGVEAFTQTVPGGSVSGFGPAVKLGVSLIFGNTIPDAHVDVPLTGGPEVMLQLAAGGQLAGCRVPSKPLLLSIGGGFDDAAFVDVICDSVRVQFMQNAMGVTAKCTHTFEDACAAATERVVAATNKRRSEIREQLVREAIAQRKAGTPSPAATTPAPAATTPSPAATTPSPAATTPAPAPAP